MSWLYTQLFSLLPAVQLTGCLDVLFELFAPPHHIATLVHVIKYRSAARLVQQISRFPQTKIA